MMALVADDGVWIPGEFPKASGRGLIRVREVEGRWIVTGLVVLAEEVTSRTLKNLPQLAGIARILNADPDYRDHVRKAVEPRTRALTGAIERAYEGAPRRASVKTMQGARPQLTRPDGRDPEGHARRVAAAYVEAVQRGEAPAPALAAEAGVPVATVRGWIREARRRGFLLPGRKGRPG